MHEMLSKRSMIPKVCEMLFNNWFHFLFIAHITQATCRQADCVVGCLRGIFLQIYFFLLVDEAKFCLWVGSEGEPLAFVACGGHISKASEGGILN